MSRSLLRRALLAALVALTSVLSAPATFAQAVASASAEGLAPVIQPFVDSHGIAGAVVTVANRDKLLTLDVVGAADVATGQPMRPNTMFWIASQSKPITSTALMILVDEGKVNLDDPVEKYLPEFKGQMLEVKKAGGSKETELRPPKHPITVWNVLSHTSGLPFRSAAEVPTLDGLTLADAVKSYAQTPLTFEPDTKYAYSNAGINTAGRIIEVVSGLPFETFVDQRLFQPLGMTDTTFWPNEEQVARLAKSYKPNDDKTNLVEVKIGQLRYPLSDRTRHVMPAGGYFSTANDCVRLCQMVLNGGTFQGKRILSETAVKEMTRRQTAEGLNSYGLGWSVNGKNFGHGGAHATNMNVDTDRGLVTVFLIQAAGGFPTNGKECQGAFNRAVIERFGKK
ncbi:MAG: beta-lactamase family protein [Planctomycetes bacterium]|nr:beta-lactamase family protein [Planctomycetota bacterium]